MKKGNAKYWRAGQLDIDVHAGIVARLTTECRGNVHDCHVVQVTCESFEKETYGANPHSGAYGNRPDYNAKNAADLTTGSYFSSAYREKKEDIPHTRNNWVCYDFERRRVVATHYTVRTYAFGPGCSHLKPWLVETSADRKSWREVAREEGTNRLNESLFTAIFTVASGRECRFIRLVQIGRNHWVDDQLNISAWEIFGRLIGAPARDSFSNESSSE
jgi:hypothetical protein